MVIRWLAADRYDLEGPWIYDHEYRPNLHTLGPAFESEGWLGFWDSFSLHVVAYHLSEPDRRFTTADLTAILAGLQVEPTFISIWGRLGGVAGPAGFVQEFEASEVETAEADVVDIASSDQLLSAKALRAARRANQAGYEAAISRVPLGPRHYEILDEWLKLHNVSKLHRSFAFGCVAAANCSQVDRIDVNRDGVLRGFGFLGRMGSSTVYLQGYFKAERGGRAGDSFFSRMVEDCIKNETKFLHLGYSGTEGLRRFKEKWGGETDRRSRYSQVVFVQSSYRRERPASLNARDEAIRQIRWLAQPETPTLSGG